MMGAIGLALAKFISGVIGRDTRVFPIDLRFKKLNKVVFSKDLYKN